MPGLRRFHSFVPVMIDFAGQFFAMAFEVELEIESEASRVPIGGTDHGPATVNDHEFGMAELNFIGPDDTAEFVDFFEIIAGGPLDK